ncbi:MAG: Gldg family protein [Anaerolineae bacterium]|nr:Gldg family protein [Anaerolineae bacterium]
MRQQNSDVVITRQRVGQIGSYAFGLALLIGVLGLVWTGWSTPVIIAFLVAAVGLATWATFTPRDFAAFITGRQARYGTIAFFSVILLSGIVAMTYLLVRERALTFDLTMSEEFTLSPETKDMLRRVTRPVQITGFYSSQNLLLRAIDDQFFRLYETETNGLIRRVYIDPDEAPAVAASFGATDGSVYISYVNDDGSVDTATLARVPRSDSQERDMTEAILRLQIAGTVTVYFDTSHSARDPLDTSPEGLSGIHAGIQESGLITAPLDMTTLGEANGDVPADAAAVLLVRPLTDYSEAEIAVMDRYLDRGGGLFIMADVLFNDDPFLKQDGAFDQYLWVNFGIRALDAAIVDPVASDRSALDVYSAAAFTGTVTDRFDPQTDPALFRLARVIEVNLESAPANVANGKLVLTSELAYGETNLPQLGQTNTFAFDDGVDLRGPLTIAGWSWDQTTNGRVLLIGDSDFVSNGMVEQYLGNGILFTDGVVWLTDLNDEITFQPQTIGVVPFFPLDQPTRSALLFGVIFLVPGLVLAAGIVISARRARQ